MITHITFDRHGVAEECDLERALQLGSQVWGDFTEAQFRRMNVAKVGEVSYKKLFQVAKIVRHHINDFCFIIILPHDIFQIIDMLKILSIFCD